MNNQNLKPFTSSNAKENGHRGGIASGKRRREKKEVKETIESILQDQFDENQDITYLEKVCSTILDESIKGNVQAIKLLLSIIGELPQPHNSDRNLNPFESFLM